VAAHLRRRRRLREGLFVERARGAAVLLRRAAMPVSLAPAGIVRQEPLGV
jgi:hypothetical protein